ncbi:MAG: GntR family transcriptional regulator [Clostridia bacterium]|nr:GntR family transcriptional regulator [Clostridia bacterium]
MTQVKFTSRADAVFDQLENDILTGVYKKGDIITETEISSALNVSRTPVREAIRRLEQEDLLKEIPKGHVVVGISPEDILDIYDIRIKIEGEATLRCAQNVTEEELNKMREAVELQEFYTLKNYADKLKGTDSVFHDLIYKNSGSDIYQSILSTLHRKVQLCRKTSFSGNDRAKEAVVEHREILTAIEKGDGELAKQLMIKHITNAKKNIERLGK